MAFVLCLFLLFTASGVRAESYLGCFQDRCSGGDCEGSYRLALSYTQETDNSLTVDRCISYCQSFVSSTVYIQYAGVENGNECFCGSEGSNYDQHGPRSDCDTPCPGDSSQMCGGEYAIAIYDLYMTHCRVPTFLHGGTSDYLVEVGMSVTFTCNSGYYLDGTSTLQCISSGPLEWNGEVPVCRQVVCNPPCMHGGQCYKLNTCSCTRQFTGDQCQTPICSPSCMNGGTCDAPDTCTCSPGYTGDQCQTPICSPSCMNGGTCDAPDTCRCSPGYTGDQCQTRTYTTLTSTPLKQTTEDDVHDQMFSNTPQAYCPCTPQNQTGLSTVLAVGMVIFIMLFVIDLSIHINYRRKIKSKSTIPGSEVAGKIEDTPRSDDAPAYQNVPDSKRQPGREDIQITILDKSQPMDAYQSLDPNTMSATESKYQSLKNKGQKDSTLYEIPENPLGQENYVYENSVFS